jgi:hypothetical protein
MKVDWTKTIEGVPMRVVRDILRKLRVGYQGDNSKDKIVDLTLTHLGKRFARYELNRIGKAIPKALLDEGLLRSTVKDHFELTDKGIALRCCRKIKRFDRARADRYISELLDRADAINANPDLLCRVKAIRLFGSAAGKTNDIGNVDAIAEMEHKINGNEYVRASMARAEAAGFNGSYLDAIHYGQTEVVRLLRARKTYLSLGFEGSDLSVTRRLKKDYGCRFKKIYPRKEKRTPRQLSRRGRRPWPASIQIWST